MYRVFCFDRIVEIIRDVEKCFDRKSKVYEVNIIQGDSEIHVRTTGDEFTRQNE